MGRIGDAILSQSPREGGFPCGVIVLGFVARWSATGLAAIYAWRHVRG